MKLLITLLCLLMLSGCTMYSVKKADGTQLTVLSSREFPNGLNIEYENTDGTKQSKFKANSGEIKNGVDPQALMAVMQLLSGARVPEPTQ